MSDKAEFHTFLNVKSWRVGFDEDSAIVGVEFVDMENELHSFAMSTRIAEQVSERIAIKVHELKARKIS